MKDRLERALRVARWEVRRLLRKRSTLLVMALFVIPLLVAAAMRSISGPREPDPGLWEVILGVDPFAGQAPGTSVALAPNVFSWWWLVVALYAGDLIAADLSEGTTRLVLSRPVSRGEYLAGKLLAVLMMFSVFATIGSYAVYASAWILAGHQGNAWGPLLIGLVLTMGSLPLLVIGMLIGMLTARVLLTTIALIVIYIAHNILVGIASIATLVSKGGGNLTGLTFRIESILSLDAGKTLATLAYNRIARGPIISPETPFSMPLRMSDRTIMLEIGPIDVGSLLPLAVASTIAWTLILGGLTWILFSRRDL